MSSRALPARRRTTTFSLTFIRLEKWVAMWRAAAGRQEALRVLGEGLFASPFLAGLQGLAQLHGHLVAPGGRQQGGHVQQGVARQTPDHHVFADLHEVGEVGGDMEGGFPLPPPGLVPPGTPPIWRTTPPGGWKPGRPPRRPPPCA